MIIYLVNRYARLKGPFDIIDSNREHIIKVGDICLRDTIEGVAFYVVCSSNNTWNACKLVGIGNNESLPELGNTLLFSFDAIHKRKGNISLLKLVSSCFREKVIIDFICNAIDILEYKRDYWDLSLFQKLFDNKQELITTNEISKSRVTSSSVSFPSHFAQYLNEDLLSLLSTTIKEGKSIKDAYFIIREKYPEQFRKALVKFLMENPSGTIYDKSPITYISEETEEKAPRDSDSPSVEDSKQDVEIDEYRAFLMDYDNKEFLKLLKQYRNGNKNALGKIVESQLRFVSAIASLYKNHGVDYNDLVQEGTIGLIKAIDLFDPSRKVQFPMYAKWWIHQTMIRALIDLRSAVYLPPSQIRLYKKVRRFIDHYEQEHGYEPSSSDINIEGCDDPRNLAYLSCLPDSLNKLTSNSDDWDNVASNVFSADEALMKESQTYYINGILNKLTSRESYILRRVYGIGEKIETLSEIGEKMGLTRERVRQIKEKSIRKLRDLLKIKKGTKEESQEEEDLEDNGQSLEEIERKRKALKILEIYKKGLKSSTPSAPKNHQYNIVNKEEPIPNTDPESPVFFAFTSIF